jgi:hypothetical protein
MSTKTIKVPLARGMEAAEHGTKPHCLGKPPVAKGYPVQIHDGMRSTNPKTGTLEWGGHGASYDTNPANPLNSGPPRGKRLTPVMASPGMKDQSATPFADDVSRAANAKAILDEAGNNSAGDDRRALGIGTLPPVVTEE